MKQFFKFTFATILGMFLFFIISFLILLGIAGAASSEKEAKVDLKSILTESKNEITKALNQDLEQNIHLSGNVQKMDVIDLFPLKKGLFIRSEITGKLKLNID